MAHFLTAAAVGILVANPASALLTCPGKNSIKCPKIDVQPLVLKLVTCIYRLLCVQNVGSTSSQSCPIILDIHSASTVQNLISIQLPNVENSGTQARVLQKNSFFLTGAYREFSSGSGR